VVRVLITGSRDWPEQQIVWGALDQQFERLYDGKTFVVVHGDARGADHMARAWANGKRRDSVEYKHVFHEAHPALWRQNGVFVPSAGHQRNKAMVDNGAAVVLAFIKDNSPGATGCANVARRAGLDVLYHRIFTEEPVNEYEGIDRTQYMSRKDAAAELGVSYQQVNLLYLRGKLRGVRRGHWIHISQESIQAMKNNQEVS
jgi:hypothetical protein